MCSKLSHSLRPKLKKNKDKFVYVNILRNYVTI